MKQLKCATLEGIDALPVTVESTLTRGLPSFTIVGLASSAISEARERVKSALLANDFTFPPKRITINLSPSDVEKRGSQFDLGIALLIALDASENAFEQWFAFGELGLDGSVKENTILYPLILSLANRGALTHAIVPKEALDKLSNIPHITFIGVENLSEAIGFFKNPQESTLPPAAPKAVPYPSQSIGGEPYYFQKAYPDDFKEIRGQEVAKRAALICACGMHNLLLEGSPGSGKSMIAKRLRYILPPMTNKELLDVAKLDALEGKDPHFKPVRPFRSPHHSGTAASIFGGFPGSVELFPWLAGREQAHAPHYSLAGGLAWSNEAGWFARIDAAARDEFYFDVSHNQQSDAYALVNARAGFAGENWLAYAWGRNLTDEYYAVRGFYFGNEPPDFPPALYTRAGDPRHVGLTIERRFH
jgi:hypothetical protein